MQDLTKLLKWKENFIALSLALIIPFTCTGCNSKKSDEQSKESFATNQDKIINENNYNNKTEDETLENDLSECENTSLSSYLEAIMSIPIMYKNEEYYLTYEQVEKLIDGDINYIKIVFNSTLKYALTNILKNATNDLSEDICKFKDLSIVMQRGIIGSKENGYTLGSYNCNLNVIYLNIDTIYSSYLENKEADEKPDIIALDDFVRCVIIHELNHVRQQACSCKLEQNIDISQIGYQDNISFILESSAESALYNLEQDYSRWEKDEFDYLYYNERKTESLILLLGLFHDDMQIEDYYNAIFDSSLKDFYQYCGVESNEEKYLLHKIWYALDSLYYRTELPFEITKENCLTSSELEDIVGTSYYADIFRLILLHMIEYTYNNPDFTIEDNLVIFNIVKNLIAENIRNIEEITEETIKYTYEEETSNAIYALEKVYLDFLSEHYQIEKAELKKLEEENNITSECWLAANQTYHCDNYCDPKAGYIITKYPILKVVLAISYAYGDEYQEFLNANSFTLSRRLN